MWDMCSGGVWGFLTAVILTAAATICDGDDDDDAEDEDDILYIYVHIIYSVNDVDSRIS